MKLSKNQLSKLIEETPDHFQTLRSLIDNSNIHNELLFPMTSANRIDLVNRSFSNIQLIREFDLSNVDLYNSGFRFCDLSFVNFSNSNLRDVNFSCCDLHGCNFSGTDLQASYMFNSVASHVILDSETILDWNYNIQPIKSYLNEHLNAYSDEKTAKERRFALHWIDNVHHFSEIVRYMNDNLKTNFEFVMFLKDTLNNLKNFAHYFIFYSQYNEYQDFLESVDFSEEVRMIIDDCIFDETHGEELPLFYTNQSFKDIILKNSKTSSQTAYLWLKYPMLRDFIMRIKEKV